MNLSEYRTQFDLHFFVPFSEEYQEVKVKLREKGHSVFHSTDEYRFFEDFKQSPSHLVLVDLTLLNKTMDDFLAECIDIASQTNFILIGPSHSRDQYWEFRDYGVLDFLSQEDRLVELIEWSIDSSLERVVLKILNKTLMNENEEFKKQVEMHKVQNSETHQIVDAVGSNIKEDFIESEHSNLDSQETTESSSSRSDEDDEFENLRREEDIANLLTLYENTRNREDLLQVFFHSLEEYCEVGAKILYFKFLEPVQLLVATHGCGIPVDQIKGAGLKLTSEELLESKTLLMSPRGFGSLNQLLKNIFHVDECYVKPLIVREDIDGLFVFFGQSIEVFNSIHFNNRFSLFRVSFERFVFLKKQMELELEGVIENILNFEDFFEVLNDRLETQQRIQMGLAVLRISVDRLHYIEENFGPTAVNSLIRGLALTAKKFTKSNDGLYRTALNEFTLLAVHLKPNEASILAERIRIAISSLDIPPVTGSITVSIGVSVYPQLAATAENLMKSSLQALTTVMGQGGNRVGIARVTRQFRSQKSLPTRRTEGVSSNNS